MNLKYMSKIGYMRKLITYLFNKIGFEKAEDVEICQKTQMKIANGY